MKLILASCKAFDKDTSYLKRFLSLFMKRYRSNEYATFVDSAIALWTGLFCNSKIYSHSRIIVVVEDLSRIYEFSGQRGGFYQFFQDNYIPLDDRWDLIEICRDLNMHSAKNYILQDYIRLCANEKYDWKNIFSLVFRFIYLDNSKKEICSTFARNCLNYVLDGKIVNGAISPNRLVDEIENILSYKNNTGSF